MKNRLAFSTRCIHAGQSPDPTTGAVMMPIYATSTFAQESPGQHKGYEYARSQNPTRMAYERCIADLEGGTQGFAFASGLAATATILDTLDHGAHIVASDDLYHLCRSRKYGSDPCCVAARDENDLGRNTDQSAFEVG